VIIDSRPLRSRIWRAFWITWVLSVVGSVGWTKFVENRATPFEEVYLLDRDSVHEYRLSWLAWHRYTIDVREIFYPPFVEHSGGLTVELVNGAGETVVPKQGTGLSGASPDGRSFESGMFDEFILRVTTHEADREWPHVPRKIGVSVSGVDFHEATEFSGLVLLVANGIVLVAGAIALAILLRILSVPRAPPPATLCD
jgi:hypothetical protein